VEHTLPDVSSFDHQAQNYINRHGTDTVEHAFAVANILHMHGHYPQAADFYLAAYHLHSQRADEYPLAPSLLQAHLICLMKDGQRPPQDTIAALRRLHIPYSRYIEGVERAWLDEKHADALALMGNSFEEFQTGEESDLIYFQTARAFFKHALTESDTRTLAPRRTIPNTLYMYWDKNPPPEIRDNIAFHQNIPGLAYKMFDREEAAEWLYQNHGIEARTLFLQARHPAEAADFLRLHVIHSLGGWWLDADLRLKQGQHLSAMVPKGRETILFLAKDSQIHNDFFGACAQSSFLTDCLLSLYRNCYRHPHLYIAFKTGPGVFLRAANRAFHAAFRGTAALPLTKFYGAAQFASFVEEFNTPYKQHTPTWHQVS